MGEHDSERKRRKDGRRRRRARARRAAGGVVDTLRVFLPRPRLQPAPVPVRVHPTRSRRII